MVQVVFGENERGALRQALHWRPSGGRRAVGVAYGVSSAGEEPPGAEREAALAQARKQVRERREREDRTGTPVGGESADIVSFGFAQDMGDISGPADGPARRALLERVFDRNDWDSNGAADGAKRWAEKHWDGLTADLQTLPDRAGAGEPVRFWVSDTPGSLCGFYDALWNLRECDCPVSAIVLPRFRDRGDGTAVSYRCWGEVTPGEWGNFLSLEREVSPVIRRAVVMEWERLKQQNAPLRAVVNGRLTGVEEDFYDFYLRREIPDGAFKVATLIGDALGRNQLPVGDWWLARRVEKMLERGELTMVERADGFYSCRVRRA